MSLMPQPARPPSKNAQHAATFFTISLFVLLIPVFMPAHRGAPPNPRVVNVTASPAPPTMTLAAQPVASVSPGIVASATPSALRSASPAAVASASPGVVASAATPTPAATPFVGPKPASVPAATGQEIDWAQADKDSTWGASSEFREKLHTVAMSLLLITALVFLTVKTLKKYMPGLGRTGSSPKPLMNVLAQQTVAPGVHLSLVQVCNKNVLIGFTDHSINVLCEISPEDMEKASVVEPAEATSAALGPAPDKAPAQVYREILNHYLSIIPGFGAKR